MPKWCTHVAIIPVVPMYTIIAAPSTHGLLAVGCTVRMLRTQLILGSRILDTIANIVIKRIL